MHPSLVALLIAAAIACFAPLASADCSVTNTGMIPLPELGIGHYRGMVGGLYPNGSNQRPPAHEAAGRNIALNQMVPRLLSGAVDTNNGKIVVLSIGMSNTTQEWATKGNGAFKPRADGDPAKDSRVVIVDGAQGGQDSITWTNRNAATWTNALNRLAAASVNSNQVQVIWLKQARANPANAGAFPLHAQSLQADQEKIVRNLKSWFPNVQLVFCSSRVRSYDTNRSDLNPEPYAYEGGFAVKWMIEKQINGDPSLNFDPARGPVVAPYLSWGPYLWSDGTSARSDGLTWLCTDLESDYTHPNTNGVTKVADQLLAFFKTDSLTRPWFLKAATTNTVIVTASQGYVQVPAMVTFSNSLAGSQARFTWTFSDGTFATSALPTVTIVSPGRYTARLTVTEPGGTVSMGEASLTAGISFSAWQAKYFTTNELADAKVSGSSADPDGDGLSNATEFSMGLDPRIANGPSNGGPTWSLSNDTIEITYRQTQFNASLFLPVPVFSDNVIYWPQPPRFGYGTDSTNAARVDEGMTFRITQRTTFRLSTQQQVFGRIGLILGP